MPNKLAILQDMVATLGTISVANGYRTDVRRVEHGIRLWDEVQANQRPYLGVAPISWRYGNEMNGVYDVELIVKIAGSVNADPGLEVAQLLDALEDDVIGALHVDVTRGANALDPARRNATSTIMRSGESDEADPKRRAHGTFLLEAVVKFQRRMGVTP